MLDEPACWAAAVMLAATVNIVTHWNVRFIASFLRLARLTLRLTRGVAGVRFTASPCPPHAIKERQEADRVWNRPARENSEETAENL
ncbi:hypothetical protein TBR22_A28620 [Luteitalea sp. TBR-22]|nr:hypothetical protein TBR22_A28620 [Luteitalea sp. TBR-22]